MKIKNNKANGFTLVEMLVVLLIISILILLMVPNIKSKLESVHSQGCDALVNLVQAQVVAYELDKGSLPLNLDTLVAAKYITDKQKTCKNGKNLILDDGMVVYE